MSSLVENLLTLARAEAGSEVLRLAPVDIGSYRSRPCESGLRLPMASPFICLLPPPIQLRSR